MACDTRLCLRCDFFPRRGKQAHGAKKGHLVLNVFLPLKQHPGGEEVLLEQAGEYFDSMD